MKQPVHICIEDNRLAYRSGNGANGNLIFQSVPRCPTVPTHRTWDNGTGRDGNNFIENRGGKQWAIIHYRNIKERQHGIPVRTAGTGVLSHTMWMKAVRPCTRLSAGATMKAVAGIITLQRSISMTTPNAVQPTVSLLAGRGRNGSLCRYHPKQP